MDPPVERRWPYHRPGYVIVLKISKETFWFTTDKGLCKYDGTNLESFTKQDGLPLKTLMKIFIDKNEVVWFTIEPANNFSKAVGPVLEALTKRGNGLGQVRWKRNHCLYEQKLFRIPMEPRRKY